MVRKFKEQTTEGKKMTNSSFIAIACSPLSFVANWHEYYVKLPGFVVLTAVIIKILRFGMCNHRVLDNTTSNS